MYRTHHCGELRSENCGTSVTLSGWVQTVRDKGHIIWVDLRDRYGITQIVGEKGVIEDVVLDQLKGLNREDVVQITGEVIERYQKNPEIKNTHVHQ